MADGIAEGLEFLVDLLERPRSLFDAALQGRCELPQGLLGTLALGDVRGNPYYADRLPQLIAYQRIGNQGRKKGAVLGLCTIT